MHELMRFLRSFGSASRRSLAAATLLVTLFAGVGYPLVHIVAARDQAGSSALPAIAEQGAVFHHHVQNCRVCSSATASFLNARSIALWFFLLDREEPLAAPPPQRLAIPLAGILAARAPPPPLST